MTPVGKVKKAMMLIVDIETGDVIDAHVAILNEDTNEVLGRLDAEVVDRESISLCLDAKSFAESATSITTVMTRNSPGCRYVKVHDKLKKVCD